MCNFAGSAGAEASLYETHSPRLNPRASTQKAKGTLSRPLGWSLQSYLFFFAAFLVAFFAAFFFVGIFYSPFSILHGSCDITSSQFVLCIESAKKIVKQKTRAFVCTSGAPMSSGGSA